MIWLRKGYSPDWGGVGLVFVKLNDQFRPINIGKILAIYKWNLGKICGRQCWKFQLYLIIFGQDIVRKQLYSVSETWPGLCSWTLCQRARQLRRLRDWLQNWWRSRSLGTIRSHTELFWQDKARKKLSAGRLAGWFLLKVKIGLSRSTISWLLFAIITRN